MGLIGIDIEALSGKPHPTSAAATPHLFAVASLSAARRQLLRRRHPVWSRKEFSISAIVSPSTNSRRGEGLQPIDSIRTGGGGLLAEGSGSGSASESVAASGLGKLSRATAPPDSGGNCFLLMKLDNSNKGGRKQASNNHTGNGFQTNRKSLDTYSSRSSDEHAGARRLKEDSLGTLTPS